MKTTRAETARTREALLDAAEQLFWERGAARAAVLDIARRAGLTRGAFYHHFSDKTEVLAALIERSRDPNCEPPPVMDDGDVDALDLLQAFCMAVLERFASDTRQQRMFAILMQGPETLGDLEPCAKSRREEIFRSVSAYEALLDRAGREGRLSPHWDPATAAATLYSLLLGLIGQWLREPDSIDIRAVGPACLSRLFAAFENRPSPQN